MTAPVRVLEPGRRRRRALRPADLALAAVLVLAFVGFVTVLLGVVVLVAVVVLAAFG